jgi:hypothetical protein
MSAQGTAIGSDFQESEAKNLALRVFMNTGDSSFGLGRRLLTMTVRKGFSAASWADQSSFRRICCGIAGDRVGPRNVQG